MKPWSQRPREEAYLLNPAFGCLTLTSACFGYNETRSQPLPFALAFMILPIVLHKRTRESLPNTRRTSVPNWLRLHGEARVGFPKRAMALRPHTREAIAYGLAFDWMSVDDSGSILPVVRSSAITRAISSSNGDARECASKARFVGRWIGTVSSTETLMALWGIRP